MILAAGRGERLRPLTDETPKPLIPIADKPLIAYHLEALAFAGVKDIVINVAYQAKKIQESLGFGDSFGVKIHYSVEPPEGGLETGGGIFNALPLLGEEPFIVLSGDIWTDYPFAKLFKPLDGLAHLVLVDNPWHHPQGDFYLSEQGLVKNIFAGISPKNITRNFAGIGLYHPKLFEHCQPGVFPLAPLLRKAIEQQMISGEYYSGRWINIGTLRCLREAQALTMQQTL
jgi:MurNAc alpha-1-phosphate uridylyltransferase